MAFCSKCGGMVGDGATFCPNCGSAIDTAPQANPANVTYAVPVVVKPKIPGRGFGITAMILGIIGVVYALSCISMTSLFHDVSDIYGEFGAAFQEGFDSAFSGAIVVYSALSILAVCFAASAFKKGYKNGISKSGMITGVIGLCLYLIALINCL